MQAHRILRGERLELEVASSIAVTLKASCRVWYDDGTTDILTIPERQTGSSRALQGTDDGFVSMNARKSGWVTDAVVVATAGVGRHGQTFCRLSIGPFSGGVLCMGYLYTLHVVAQGVFEKPGPDGGEGFLEYTQITFDSAGNVDSSLTLAATNTIRKYYGVVVFLNADGNAASRIPTIRLGRTAPLFTKSAAGNAGGPPTGFGGSTGSGDMFSLAGPTVTLGQEGSFWIYNRGKGDGYIAFNANGTVTMQSTATVPCPFPIEVREDDLGTLDITITAGLAGDRYAAYAIVEEWIVF